MLLGKLGNSESLRALFVALLLICAPAIPQAQTEPSAGATGSDLDALSLLKETSSRYSHLRYYHIEMVQETQMARASSRDLYRQNSIAAIEPGNRYRFELAGSMGSYSQVSNGQSEWLYVSNSGEYVEHPTPASGYENPAMEKPGLMQIQEVQGMVRELSRIQNHNDEPVHFLANDTLKLNGKEVACRTVLVLPKPNDKERAHNLAMTIYWIDDTHVIRKLWQRYESYENGGFTPGETVTDVTQVYPVMELGESSTADSLFSFTPPPTANRVTKFTDYLEQFKENEKKDGKREDNAKSSSAPPATNPKQPAESRSPALELLQQTAQRYETATYYHIEAERARETDGEFSRNSSRERTVATVEPGNRYRFEVFGAVQLYLQVSDGKNEWIFQPFLGQYTQQPVPASGPGATKLPMAPEMKLQAAREAVAGLARAKGIRSAAFLPDEIIELDGRKYSCQVVAGSPAGDVSGTSVSVYWIDKEAHVIRKVAVHTDRSESGHGFLQTGVSDDTTSYPVVELGPSSSVSDSEFVFTPPPTASRVAEFDQGGLQGMHTAEIENKPAPDITLTGADGQVTSLKAWKGKPLLLDFWATWCGACIASLPGVEKIYHEFEAKGLAVISIDEDDAAKDAMDFLEDHKRPWPNFHDEGGKIRAAFPKKGIPYFVLIDGHGQIAYASIGFFDPEMRAALAKLGPEFASSSASSKE
jgi:outer membrane lipoprotein-sorting protein/thiol-disulfide isomerase/thioredoxin